MDTKVRLQNREGYEISPRRRTGRGRHPSSRSSRLRLGCAWILVGLYAGAIFVLSSLSDPPSPSPWDLPDLDKLYHFLEYGGLTFVLLHALKLAYPTSRAASLACWAVVLVIVYGALDEVHQAFTPNRTMSLYDLVANAAGAIGVASLWLWVRYRWPRLVKS
jgi:VanZ family protein